MYKRILKLDLPPKQSAFLWGPRKTGKSSLLKEIFPNAIYYDFLKSDVYLRFLKAPHLLRQELLAKEGSGLVIIDEVQKIPVILDEVHWLIENTEYQFILSGSSARALKKTQANMLGGRAWRFEMFPLVYPEVSDFELLGALNRGLIPDHYMSSQYKRFQRAYVQDYLKEEIKEEALVRNLSAFSRFLDCVAFCHTELLNYNNIASDVGVDAKTVKEYFNILADTLIGRFLEPLPKSKAKRKDLIKSPKFYFFDEGIVNFLKKVELNQLKGSEAGVAFESFLVNQVFAYNSYFEKDLKLNFFKTYSDLEVDLVINSGEVLIEFKITQRVKAEHISSLKVALKTWPTALALVVCNEPEERIIQVSNDLQIRVMPWEVFLKKLWSSRLF